MALYWLQVVHPCKFQDFPDHKLFISFHTNLSFTIILLSQAVIL